MLWRAKVSMKLKVDKVLPDGSWLATWKSATRGQKDERGVSVRVIEYRLKGGNGETFRLITSLLDHETAPARELAALYPQCWEIELAIKEGKHVLRSGQITLRSKMPELVRQKFWGVLLAHYIVRKMMARAALDGDVAPDVLSYQSSVEIIRSSQTGPVLAFFPPQQRVSQQEALLKEIGRQKVSSSRGKSKERSIKAKPRQKFAPRPLGSKVRVKSVLNEVEVLS